MQFVISRSYAEPKSTILSHDLNFFFILLTLGSCKIYLGRGKRNILHNNKNIDEDIEVWNKHINYLLAQ